MPGWSGDFANMETVEDICLSYFFDQGLLTKDSKKATMKLIRANRFYMFVLFNVIFVNSNLIW